MPSRSSAPCGKGSSMPPAGELRRVAVSGDREKLAFMRANIDAGATDPQLVELASTLARPFRADDWRGRAQVLHRFVRDGIRYQRDPNRREQIADPLVTLRRGYDDCDGKVALFVSLARALGLDADIWPVWRPGSEGTSDPELEHVQSAVRWPRSAQGATLTHDGADVLDAPPGRGWLVSDPTIAGAELGVDPRVLPKNPDTGKPALA